jgi:hypothetical protein
MRYNTHYSCPSQWYSFEVQEGMAELAVDLVYIVSFNVVGNKVQLCIILDD